MSAVERQLAETIDNMDIEGFLDRFDMTDLPRRDSMSLQRKRSSLTVTVPSDLWKKNGHSLDDPGEVDVLYWEQLGIAMIDVRGEFDERE